MAHTNISIAPTSWGGPFNCIPYFFYEFDVSNREEFVKYCHILDSFRHLSLAYHLRPGQSFIVSIEPQCPSKRPLPSFALEAGSLQLVLETALQTGPEWSSQVLVADVRRPGQSFLLGKVVMKIFMSSLLPSPKPYADHPLKEYVNPRQLQGTEHLVYNELKSLQGSIIPYYYGLHELKMPHGEMAVVALLEYIEGQTLTEWVKSYPEHRDGPALNATLGEDYLDQAKRLYVSILHGFNQINKKSVVHFEAVPTNMIVTEDYEIVIIDFARSGLHANEEMVRRGSDAYYGLKSLLWCCDEHSTLFKEWSDTQLPDGLVKPCNFFGATD